jgi:hypothetical protein
MEYQTFSKASLDGENLGITNFAKTNKTGLILLIIGLLLFISGCVNSSKETITSAPAAPLNTPAKVATAVSTPIPKETSGKTLAQGETWNIGGGWTLTTQSMDMTASPKQVWLVLSKNGIKLDDKVSQEGEIYSYLNIFSTRIASIYAGSSNDMVVLTDTLLADKKTLSQGETWNIGGGWTLTAQSMDMKASPKQVWLVLSRNGIKLDDEVVEEGEVYYYNFLSTKIASIYSVPTGDIVLLTDTLMRPDSITLGAGETWEMGRGWTLTAQSMDMKASPKQVWLVLSKNGIKLDDKVVSLGRTYNYNNIFSTKINDIFAGTQNDLVTLTNTKISDSPIPISTPKTTPTEKPRTYSVTYYSGWLQTPYGPKIYFTRATNFNCEYAGQVIGTSDLYTCIITGGSNAGTYSPVLLWNVDQETETVTTTPIR